MRPSTPWTPSAIWPTPCWFWPWASPADPAISFEQDDLTESQSSAGTIEGDLTEMGKVYYDKETGTYYIVENQKTGDAE